MNNKNILNIRRNKYLLVIESLLVVFFVILGGCGPSNPTTTIQVTPTGINTGGGGLVYEPNPFPAWTAGRFGSVQLQASGGRPAYAWRLAPGSQLPQGFTLNANGVLAGTPPLLAGGTTKFITPPFNVIVRDADGNEKQVELRITIIQPAPSVFNLNVNVNPAGAGSFTQSLSPETDGYHEGNMIMLTAAANDGWVFVNWTTPDVNIIGATNTTVRFNMPANDVNATANFEQIFTLAVSADPPEGGAVAIVPNQAGYRTGDTVTLTAVPAEGWEFDEWESADVVIVDAQNTVLTFNMPQNNVAVTARFTELAPDIFITHIETLMGYFSASNGCQWEEWACGDVTISLKPTEDGSISGTVEFSITLEAYVVSYGEDAACNGFSALYNFGGALTGTESSFSGTFASTGARPLQITITASKVGDNITCTLTLTKTMQVDVNGIIESYPVLTATVTVSLHKQR